MCCKSTLVRTPCVLTLPSLHPRSGRFPSIHHRRSFSRLSYCCMTVDCCDIMIGRNNQGLARRITPCRVQANLCLGMELTMSLQSRESERVSALHELQTLLSKSPWYARCRLSADLQRRVD